MASHEDLRQIIEEYSTTKYHIEYKRFLSNHVSHGIIALYRLGATKTRILDFVKWYIPRLEQKSGESAETSDTSQHAALAEGEVKDLLGKRKEFHKLKDHFAHALKSEYNEDIEEFVRHEFEKLADGMHVAALHPVIHLGYAIDAGIPELVVEGIAYLHFSHMPIKAVVTDGTPSTQYDILQILDNLKNDKPLRHNVIRYSTITTWMPDISGTFQREVGALLSHPWLRSQIQMALDSLMYPEWFNKDSFTIGDVRKLMDTALHWAITAYACAEKRNDFFLLHGVTGAWSLTKILDFYKDPEKAFNTVKYYLATLLSVYIAQKCPAIKTSFLENAPETSIEELVAEAVALTVDEHVYKLVQVCNELSKVNDDPNRLRLYKVACRNAIDNPFKFE